MTQDMYDHLPSWPEFVERVLAVVILSLELLQQMDDLPTGEIPLNVCLTRCIRRANRQLNASRDGVPWPCSYDGIQGLTAGDEEVYGPEQKRPDCRWGLTDLQDSNPETHEKNFDIECKRLGAPSSSSATWVFNEKYITNGVCRFINAEHSYGRGVERGLMIGYVQSMELDDILSEVNLHGQNNGLIVLLSLINGWQNPISRLENICDRSFDYSPFRVEHLWVDLRATST